MKKKSIPSEAWEQEQVFNFAYNNQAKYPGLKYMTGSINGVPIPIGLRVKLTKQGLKSGVPDIDYPGKNKKYSGLHIELKRVKNGKLSEEQKDYIRFLTSQGRFACVCEGHKAAIAVIIAYLEDDEEGLRL